MDRFDREERIQRALIAYRADPDHNISNAAVDEGISAVTLWDRVHGRQPKLFNRPNHAKLTVEQERVLAQHTLRLQQQLRPINYKELRVVANALAMENYNDPTSFNPVGQN